MFQPNDHAAAHVDDYLHGLLNGADADHVRRHTESCPVCKEALEQAQRRKAAIEAVPPEKAPEPLIQETVVKADTSLPTPPRAVPEIEPLLEVPEVPPLRHAERNTRPPLLSPTGRRLFYGGILALAASLALVLGIIHLYYSRLSPSPYTLAVLGQKQMLAGAPGSLRVRLTNQETRLPVGNVPVEMDLVGGPKGQIVHLASFTTDREGTGTPRFTLPEWENGQYQLRVRAKTDGGEERLEHPIELKRSWRLMLSTDKPVYQPGQTILVRSLSLRKPDLKPVAGQVAVFTITDPKGNIIFKQSTATSRFGIAAAECPLATEILEGPYTITCTLGDSTSKNTVQVHKYVLPKFKIEATLDKPYYQPGQRVNVTVQTDYFFGKPVQGGQVKLLVSSTEFEQQVLQRLEGKTDETGKAKFDFLLPQNLVGREQDRGDARFNLMIDVQDTAEQTQRKQVSRLVTTQPLKIEIIPEAGRLIPGVANTIYLWVSYADGQPAANVRLAVAGQEQELTTNTLGLASYSLTPPPDSQSAVVVQATDAQGRTGRKAVTVTSAGSPDFLCRPDQAVYDGGATVKLTTFGSGIEPVFVDFIKDGQTLLTEAVAMTNGRGELAFDLPPEVFGTIEIVAYRYKNRSGLPVRQSRVIYVRQARQLRIAAAMDHKEYRPGGKAVIKLNLADDKGKPTPGAISLAAVDEAVYAVLEQAPGMERIFFLLEQQLLKPVYAIYPWAPDLLEAVKPEERQEFDRALFSRTVESDKSPDQETQTRFSNLHTLALETFAEKVQRIARERTEGLRWSEAIWAQYVPLALALGALLLVVWFFETFDVVRIVSNLSRGAFPIVGWIAVGVFLCLGAIIFFGQRASTTFSNVGQAMNYKTITFESMRDASGMGGIGGSGGGLPSKGGAGGGRGGPVPGMPPQSAAPMAKADAAPAAPMGGDRAEPAAAEPVRVREWFPETLLWRPEVITNDQGEARVEVELADSITTWRLLASAVSAQGQLGSYQGAVKVFQPFFCDMNLPVALTRNDEVAVPVVVYNYLTTPQTVELTLHREDWFTLLDEEKKSIALAPGEVKATAFRFKVQKVGLQTLQVTARGSGVADAMKKPIEVVPDGRRVDRIVNGALLQPVDLTLNLPADAIPGSGKMIVKFYPSTFSQLVEGLDGIFRQPYGCFEQTSSTTYPNVLALDYLRRINKSVPEVEAKARQFIHLGYQRLISFEVPGGGFDWFGRPPANVTLTAYGLMEFEDMSRVHDVDPELIRRTRRWLLGQRLANGSWPAASGMLHDDFHRRMQGLSTTAYIAWSVFARDVNPHEARVTWNYLVSHRPETIDDPYTLALVCNALLAINPSSPEVKAYLARLESLKQTSPDGKQVSWGMSPGRRTQFYGGGNTATVETTALAALAFMKAREYPGSTNGALAWLISQKDGNGTWHGTQSTVLALKALIAGTGATLSSGEERRIAVTLNDGDRREVRIVPDQAEVMQQLDLTPLLRSGENRLRITEPTGTATGFQVAFWHHVPGEPAKGQEPLAIQLQYDRTTLKVNDSITVQATIVNQMPEAAPMVMLDLPIPAGFNVQTEDFAKMVAKGQIAKFQVTPRSVVVYLLRLAPQQKLELHYHLQATMPVKLQAPGGLVYEYYDRQKRGTSPSVALVVE